MQIYTDDDVMIEPFAGIKIAASACLERVAYFARRAVSVPSLAKCFRGNADELAEVSPTLPVNLQIHGDSNIEKSITPRCDRKRGIRLGYYRKVGKRRREADTRIIIVAIPALPFEGFGEVLRLTLVTLNAVLFRARCAHAPLVVAPQQGNRQRT